MKVTQSCLTLYNPMDYSPWNSPDQSTEVLTFHFSRGSSQPRDWDLQHSRLILYQLSHKGSLKILEWVAYPFSSGSSQPRNWTGVSCTAGRFFTNWAIREAFINGKDNMNWDDSVSWSKSLFRCIDELDMEKLRYKWWKQCKGDKDTRKRVV